MKNQYFVFIALLIGLFGCKKETEKENKGESAQKEPSKDVSEKTEQETK